MLYRLLEQNASVPRGFSPVDSPSADKLFKPLAYAKAFARKRHGAPIEWVKTREAYDGYDKADNLIYRIEKIYARDPLRKNPETEIRELVLFADNESSLANQKASIIKNLRLKQKKGIYDSAKAAKLWQYLIDNAAKEYNHQFGVGGRTLRNSIFTVADRRKAAAEFESMYRGPIARGEYDPYASNPGKGKRKVKKKRSAKQRANDKRLGQLAKARAKYMSGGKKKKRKKTAKRRANPRKGIKLYNIFFGVPKGVETWDVYFIGTRNGNEIGYTTAERNLAYRFMSAPDAKQKLSALNDSAEFSKTMRSLRAVTGVVSDDTTVAQIKAKLSGK